MLKLLHHVCFKMFEFFMEISERGVHHCFQLTKLKRKKLIIPHLVTPLKEHISSWVFVADGHVN